VVFARLKEALTTAPILYPSVWGEFFELIYDASNYAVGVVLGKELIRNPM